MNDGRDVSGNCGSTSKQLFPDIVLYTLWDELNCYHGNYNHVYFRSMGNSLLTLIHQDAGLAHPPPL